MAFFRRKFFFVAALLIILGIALGISLLKSDTSKYKTASEADPYVRFDMEAYDLISQNYWVAPGSYARFNAPELPALFELALQKASGTGTALATSTRTGVAEMLAKAFQNATSSEAKKNLALSTLQVVLYNLPPAGRDGLLSKTEETSLRQTEANVNPKSDLYGDLGLADGASVEDVKAAYTKKAAELAASSSTPEALKKIAYAKDVLTSPVGKTLYDSGKIEPSAWSHILGHTLYISFNKISPTSLQEFAVAIDNASTTPGLDSMILDMRGNIGGALDFTENFLGLFLGSDQYAFDLYHQGDKQVIRTTQAKFPELSRYGEIAILTDDMTQSTAELTAAAMKRFRLAYVVGGRTRGWGSVENTYPLATSIDPSTTYSLLLVNSLTLRDDGEPIESNGVQPDVDISSPDWAAKLSAYFRSASLVAALKETALQPPLE
jgi:hypothetical protein